jgi:hypothetical protein
MEVIWMQWQREVLACVAHVIPIICHITLYATPNSNCYVKIIFVHLTHAACSSTVGRATALQAGSSWVQFLMVSMGFFIDIILPAYYGTGVDSASNRTEYQEYFLGV